MDFSDCNVTDTEQSGETRKLGASFSSFSPSCTCRTKDYAEGKRQEVTKNERKYNMNLLKVDHAKLTLCLFFVR